MGSTWSTTNAKRTLDMRVKVALLAGDSDFQRVTYFSTTDTVAGWGTLTLPSMAATPVLMIKVNKMRTDSFYLNGTAVGPLILGAFHLPSQGNVTSDYSYQFFAQGSYAAGAKGRIFRSGLHQASHLPRAIKPHPQEWLKRRHRVIFIFIPIPRVRDCSSFNPIVHFPPETSWKCMTSAVNELCSSHFRPP